MGNKFPRATVKLRENSPGYFEATFPPWVVDHLRGEDGSILKPSVWPKGSRVLLEEDAVIFEIVRED